MPQASRHGSLSRAAAPARCLGERALTEICGLCSGGAKVLVRDEPTAVLTAQEARTRSR
jgi:ABC-type sugar transport system ATPase subunit